MSLFGWLTGEDAAQKARDQAAEISAAGAAAQRSATEQAMAAYTDYMNKALATSSEGQNKALAATLAGGQASADLARSGAIQKQSWNLPTQAASLSALQALPQMQMLMGMPAYNLPTSIDTSLPPSVNLAGLYKNAEIQMTKGADGSWSSAPTGPGNSGNSAYQLTPFSGQKMDITASPMFKWQQGQMQENVNRDLAARGYGSSPAGASILANEYAKLTGAETDKTYNRLQDMYRSAFGEGSAGGTPTGTAMANAPSATATNLSGIYNDAAKGRAGLYGDAAATAASGYGALGTNALNAAQTQAGLALASGQGASPLAILQTLYGMYSGFGGGRRVATSGGNYYDPNAIATFG